MKPLTIAERAGIIGALVEGMSIRGVSRMLGFSQPAILKVVSPVGEACEAFQHEHLRNLPCDEIQMDEIFSFVGSEDKKPFAEEHTGDTWTWIALCAKTKLPITWQVGDRSHRSAFAICADLAARVPEDAQVTTDGLAAYRSAMASMMPLTQFAQLVKIYALLGWEERLARSFTAAVQAAFPDAEISGYAKFIDLVANDEKDRHVLAAAIKSKAEMIVTFNLKHFPKEALAEWSIRALHPSDYLITLYEIQPSVVVHKLEQMAAKSKTDLQGILQKLKAAAPAFCVRVRDDVGGL